MLDEVFQTTWLPGFVSGASFFGVKELREASVEGMNVWVDNYCHKNPLDTLDRAAANLVRELGG